MKSVNLFSVNQRKLTEICSLKQNYSILGTNLPPLLTKNSVTLQSKVNVTVKFCYFLS